MNRDASSGRIIPVSHELFEVLWKVFQAAYFSEGTFDPTVRALMKLWNFGNNSSGIPKDQDIVETLKHTGYRLVELQPETECIRFLSEKVVLDPGGWGKGYALECCRDCLLTAQVSYAVLNFGSSFCVIGNCPDSLSGKWKIGIQKPWNPRGTIIGTIRVKSGAVSTSAGYDNFYYAENQVVHHLLNPKTGKPASGPWSSSTVVCSSPFYSDILSTVLFIGGEHAAVSLLKKIHLLNQTDWVLIDNQNHAHVSSNGFADYTPLSFSDR